jgi:hypothetical protein
MNSLTDALNSAVGFTEAALAKPRFKDGTTYAEMLMRDYPERVLRFLETMTDEELQVKVGKATPQEANADFHGMMLRETAKHGCE